MLMYSDRRMTPQSAKRGPPFGLQLEAHRTASRLLHGQPARAAIRSLPVNLQRQSRRVNLTSSRSKLYLRAANMQPAY
jgi:hypothetical protein